MKRGVNYFNWIGESTYQRPDCVFISHQKNDRKAAKLIADFLLDNGISVYFDEYDTSIDRRDPNKLTASIQRGIDYSSHMLVLISRNTLHSLWVPWEVGYGYDKTDLSILTLKGIEDYELPDYLKTTKIRRNYNDLKSLIISIKPSFINEARDSYFSNSNPLSNILD